MRINKKYTLKMVCIIIDPKTNDIEESFHGSDAFLLAKKYTEKTKRPIKDILFRYVVVDRAGETPEEIELFFETPEEAIAAVL